MVSSEVLNKRLSKEQIAALGVAKWEGSDPKYMTLSTIDRFKPVFKGDTVVTSMQNAIFPPKIMIGKISRITSSANEAFYKIDVKLSTDFSSLVYVYIVDNNLIYEQNKIETNPIE